jgi:glucoamylase
VLITVLPEAGRPDYNIFWLRDALLAYHAWFIELVLSPKDQQIRALVDDYVHALVRTQHVDNIAGNTFSGGLEEALFDLHIGVIKNPDYRIGSPAAGVFNSSDTHNLSTLICLYRRATFPSTFPDRVR